MGRTRKKGGSGLGRALVKDRFGAAANQPGFNPEVAGMYTTMIDDKKEKAKAMQSITQMNDFAEWLHNAEAQQKDFTAEKENTVVLSGPMAVQPVDMSDEQAELQRQHWNAITIPRRPLWNNEMTPEELKSLEKSAFLEWRRTLAELEDEKQLCLTPFEKNIEVWRQLWRVVERSDLVVQIVDARNPLLFRCPDLEKYIHEVDPSKKNLLLINKSDLLTRKQRITWAKYFKKSGIRHAFFSANFEQMKIEQRELERQKILGALPVPHFVNPRRGETDQDLIQMLKQKFLLNEGKELDSDEDDDEEEGEEGEEVEEAEAEEGIEQEEEQQPEKTEEKEEEAELVDEGPDQEEDEEVEEGDEDLGNGDEFELNDADLEVYEEDEDQSRILTREQLLEYLVRYYQPKEAGGRVQIGMVGYPNVGKSSTINVLVGEKKVAVAAQPGKTKHFQTINLGDHICLCDCPGLVFPTFASTKADMVCNGLISIDHMRDYRSPCTLLCNRIPRHVLEEAYGIVLPKPTKHEDPDRSATAEELLQAHATVRGFFSVSGVPNESQSARYVLKDYYNGRLCYAYPPPGVNSKKFNRHNVITTKNYKVEYIPDSEVAAQEAEEVRLEQSKAKTSSKLTVPSNNTEEMLNVIADKKKRSQKRNAKTTVPGAQQGDLDPFFIKQTQVNALVQTKVKKAKGKKAAKKQAEKFNEAYTRTKFTHSPIPLTKENMQKILSIKRSVETPAVPAAEK